MKNLLLIKHMAFILVLFTVLISISAFLTNCLPVEIDDNNNIEAPPTGIDGLEIPEWLRGKWGEDPTGKPNNYTLFSVNDIITVDFVDERNGTTVTTTTFVSKALKLNYYSDLEILINDNAQLKLSYNIVDISGKVTITYSKGSNNNELTFSSGVGLSMPLPKTFIRFSDITNSP